MLFVALTELVFLLKWLTLHLKSVLYRGLAISAVCAALYAQSAHASWLTLLPSERTETPLAEWEPEAGDSFVVDTLQNIGYLVHEDGGYTSFPVVTGLREFVRYIGMTYFAATPERQWTVLSNERKGKSVTFGEDGTFLRLYYKDKRTPYGIHSHAYVHAMLARDERFGSMGCVILSEELLDLVEQTFHTNGDRLDVVTKYGLGEEVVTETVLKKALGKNI